MSGSSGSLSGELRGSALSLNLPAQEVPTCGQIADLRQGEVRSLDLPGRPQVV